MSTDDELSQIETISKGSLVSIDKGAFWLDAGFYKDEGFILLEIGLCEITRAYPGKQINILHLHITYFHFDFGLVLK